MNKQIIAFYSALLTLFFAYVYASPYITLFMLKRAIDTKSAKGINTLIDFPNVRDSLRSQLATYIQEQTSKTGGDSSLAQFTVGIGSAIGGSFIDIVVQPKNLERWLDGDKINGITAGQSMPSSADIIEKSNPDSMRYISFDRFEVVAKSGSVVQSVQLERRNLVVWKIVYLGLDLLNINTTSLVAHGDKSQEHMNETTKRITYTSGSGDGIIEVELSRYAADSNSQL